MNSLTDKEINRASDGIDKALSTATRSNRGEVAFRILSVVRNLNDHIAFKIWKDVRPDQKMDINKVASKFGNVRPYQFIARFDHFLRASVSHFTPSEEGAERLMIKYYRYLLQLKKAVYDRYGMIILRNIDMFLEDLDEQTKDYYQKVATEIEKRLRNVLPDRCCHELTIPHRSPDEQLQRLWEEVRNMDDDNIVLEKMVRSDYSHPIDSDIFDSKSDDEIILCLNYNGLYGLNNINRLLQLNNSNPAVDIGVWRFKVGDPILFNDSGRFSVLYNNMKGRILSIQDSTESVYFTVEIDALLDELEVLCCYGLDYIGNDGGKTQVGFNINRTKPYSSDEERTTMEHIVPFQIAYAVSIHKAQGLEYDSVKIVIADETEDQITHNIFYTAITRAKQHLTIYWSPEVCNRILARIRPVNYKKDFQLLKAKNNL